MRVVCQVCGMVFTDARDWSDHALRGHCFEGETPTLPPARKDSLDNSEPPIEGSYHEFVGRMEYRADRRETREWRDSNDARLRGIEKRLTLVGLAIAAITAATNGTVPWGRIAQALGW